MSLNLLSLHKQEQLGKRIFRLTSKQELSGIDFLMNKLISIVLNDGRVYPCYFLKSDQNTFYCKNMLNKTFQIKLEDIKEVIYDIISNF